MLDFIINPIAGKKHGRILTQKLEIIKSRLNELKVSFKLHFTKFKGHAKQLVSKLINEGSTDIIVVGGDGTLHEVINGFSNFDKVNLGLIPCGTGNDFAWACQIPTDVNKALDKIIFGKPQYTDFMQMPTVRGINVIGTGIDVDVLRHYNAKKKKNKLTYTTCLIKTLFNFKYTKFKAILDQKEYDYNSFIACIANGSVYGGGIPVCPVATPTDNKLNFVAVKAIKKIKIIGAFLKLKKGKILSLPQAEHYLCDQVKIQTELPCTVNVDGELYNDIPFEVEIVKNTLKMYR